MKTSSPRLTNRHTLVPTLFLALGLATNGQAQSFLVDGLVASYPFNGNANDASGNANNMTANGASLTTDRFGQASSAFNLNGVSDYLAAANRINNVIDSFTISAWFHTIQGVTGPAVPETGIPTLLWASQGTEVWGDDSAGVGIGASTNRVVVYEHADRYVPYVVVSEGDFTGWTHVVAVYRNKAPSLFINGKLAGTGAQSPKGKVRPSNGESNSPGGFGGVQNAVLRAKGWEFNQAGSMSSLAQ